MQQRRKGGPALTRSTPGGLSTPLASPGFGSVRHLLKRPTFHGTGRPRAFFGQRGIHLEDVVWPRPQNTLEAPMGGCGPDHGKLFAELRSAAIAGGGSLLPSVPPSVAILAQGSGWLSVRASAAFVAASPACPQTTARRAKRPPPLSPPLRRVVGARRLFQDMRAHRDKERC